LEVRAGKELHFRLSIKNKIKTYLKLSARCFMLQGESSSLNSQTDIAATWHNLSTLSEFLQKYSVYGDC
jgi:hypothetical protein